MNENILDMTKVSKRPSPADFYSPSNSTPVAGTHAAKVKKEEYEKFLKELDEVYVHVYKSWSNPLAMGLQGREEALLCQEYQF